MLRGIAYCTLIVAAILGVVTAPAQAAGWRGGAIVQRDGYPVFEMHGRPFFVYGAAFFYERTPRDQWEPSLRRLRQMGINTLDLYVIWNWHELADGDFDFTGRTNPRHDLRGFLRLARRYGFAIVMRPGPVIRNEWRNGGYPSWLLARSEYGMPLRDRLEGRYPPTATLQNAHSDDAAAEWMRNRTHVHYARRWLEHALREFEPDADQVIAIALDDDQGAYIDNQTWPAPHLRTYLHWLGDCVRRVVGSHVPLFINTYEMKVTASAPVWAMGNWYQSDAYAIGEHDRSQLTFATALLQTQPHVPIMVSEFQAGWLEQPGDVLPRSADPSNTRLALSILLGLGAHGVVNFPAQDTLYPDGWEVPFANAFYAWNAGLDFEGRLTERGRAMTAFGRTIQRYGSLLAQTHVAADAAIIYLTSAFDARKLDNADIGAIAAATQEAQRRCRIAGLTCDLVDLRYADDATLRRYPILVVPVPDRAAAALRSLRAREAGRLQWYARRKGIVVAVGPHTLGGLPQATIVGPALDGALIARALGAAHTTRTVDGMPGASLLVTQPHGPAFLVAQNYDRAPARYTKVVVHLPGAERIALGPQTIAPRGTILLAFHVPNAAPGARVVTAPRDADPPATCKPFERLPIRNGLAPCAKGLQLVEAARAIVYRADPFGSGYEQLVLQNARVRIVVAPQAGGRAFVFENLATGRSVFTTVGASRDDVAVQPPPSTTDRIGKYTNTFSVGTFNREYQATILQSGTLAVVRLKYFSPDAYPRGATFERTLTLAADATTFSVDESVSFRGSPGAAPGQSGVSLTSLAVGDPHAMTTQLLLGPELQPFTPNANIVPATNAFGFYDRKTNELASIAWRPQDVSGATVTQRTDSVVVRLVLAPNRTSHVEYGYETLPSPAAARAAVEAAAAALQGRPTP